MADQLPRGIVPPGTYAGGGRSPIVYVQLCPPCAGYAPITPEDYDGYLSGRCQGCGANSRELHRFQALIMSAANGGCMCDSGHRQVTGDLPTEEMAGALMLEVRSRPAPAGSDVAERRRAWRASLRDAAPIDLRRPSGHSSLAAHYLDRSASACFPSGPTSSSWPPSPSSSSWS